MLRYRTEIVIPPDRYVCLQLPEGLPEGQAIVTVHFHDAAHPANPDALGDVDPDHEDIEWWEEFEDGAGPVE